MTPREKIDAAVEELRDRRVRSTTAAPPLYRLLWTIGIHVPPPLFQSFLGVITVQGAFFGLFMSGFVAFLSGPGDRWELAIELGLASGLVFGLLMAAYFRWYARRLGLPRWADYCPG